MKFKIDRKDFVPLVLTVLSAVFLLLSFNYSSNAIDTSKAAHKTEQAVTRRISVLERYMDAAIKSPDNAPMILKYFPEDMVIYRYVGDTLKAWCNQFTIKNDDISKHVTFSVMANPATELESTLLKVSDKVSLLEMGPRWYLTKTLDSLNVKIIGGLQIYNAIGDHPSGGVNRRLHLSDKFSVKPLSDGIGTAVEIDGVPVFKVVCESLKRDTAGSAGFIGLSFFFFLAGALIFLYNKRTLKRFAVTVSVIVAALLALYLWGRNAHIASDIFSPAVYADGNFFYSLGAVLIINLAVIVFIVCTYLIRRVLYREVISTEGKRNAVIYSAVLITAVAGIFAYTAYALRSITLNSGICLELYKLNNLSVYSLVVYIAFIALFMTLQMLLQMLQPAIRKLTGKRYDCFSARHRILMALVFSIFVVIITATTGFRKEQNIQEVWANRLSIDRDIALEMNLRRVEGAIASDKLIATLAGVQNTANIILNRITDNYMSRFLQDYDISLYIMNAAENSPEMLSFYREKLEHGKSIASGSKFLYSTPGGAHAVYTGVFVYFSQYSGITHLIIDLEPKANKQDKGYASLLGIAAPGKVIMPARYDYAKYSGSDIVTFRGSFAYPTVMEERIRHEIYDNGIKHFKDDGHLHFVNHISDDEVILISRPIIEATRFVFGCIFLALFTFFALTLSLLTRKRRKNLESEKQYYKSRVSSVLVGSLLITLVAMASVSILFVYKRNDDNLKTAMTDKISAIQALVSSYCRSAKTGADLGMKEVKEALESASSVSGTDVTLYRTDGKVLQSTTPEFFDKTIIGSRIHQDAFDNIIYKNKRFFIHKETIGKRKYYAMYAPVFNSEGKIISIVGTPYTDENYDFEMEAVLHFVTIITLFLILLIVARFMILAIVTRMFKPLSEMGRKMNAADVASLEYLDYTNEDEITSLVQSYNRMVGDLTRSTRQLAQAERDKAWSAMARQVAHEIKNPLTPMKLQIQRLIRLKQKGAADWDEKFNEVSKVVLDHIDILTDTANEFSTFAKLYSEEPTRIDLDALIQEEISMFNSREDIEFVYLGIDGAEINGPKPQLTRVLVNLLTNAIQAIEIRRQHEIENGVGAEESGHILVQLRNSLESGYYDITVEDDGQGVSEENQEKLFTPNFTTKTGGTGLGLAICRSILERCGASISYSRSFSLDGACFTIKYPRNNLTI